MPEQEHSKNFEKVKGFYDQGSWSKQRVYNAVTNGAPEPWITVGEYEEITGEQYVSIDIPSEAPQEIDDPIIV